MNALPAPSQDALKILNVLVGQEILRGRELQWKSSLTDSQKFADAVRQLDGFEMLQIEGPKNSYDDLCGSFISLRPSATQLVRYIVRSKATA
ncbi:MAG: hypothetical protein ACKVW3_10300 [Phycisphaerales bacterium]